jgi:hypothetical protein
MIEEAFMLVLKFCLNNNAMWLRQVCTTFNIFILNYTSKLNICCSFDTNCWKSLTKLIRMMPNLTCLNLILLDDHLISVLESNLALFFQSILRDLLKLTSLGIKYNSTGDINANLLTSDIANLTNLTSLSLKIPVTRHFVPIFVNLPKLKSLTFQFKNIYEPIKPKKYLFIQLISSFAQTLANSNMTLEKLDLSHNRLKDSEIQLLVPGLNKLINLISINFDDNHITDEGIEMLVPIISKMTKLKTVNFRSNRISFSKYNSFLCILDKLPELTDLNIADNFIMKDGFLILLPILATLTNLTSLSLDSPRQKIIKDLLTSSLVKLSNLKCLSLPYTNFEVLEQTLPTLTNLMILNLNSHYITPEELSLLKPSLIRMTSMTSLTLESDEIRGLPGAESLIEIFTSMKNLNFLKIDGFHLGSEGKELLLDIFRTMPKLRYDLGS